MEASAGGRRPTTTPSAGTAVLLLRACHPEPTAAVTLLAGLIAFGAGLPAGVLVLVVLAVLSGQLSIGWSNDLLDAARDRQVGRADKPLATGVLSARLTRTALVLALVSTVTLSLLAGAWSALAHLGFVVGSGFAYNLGLKSTAWSWLPYAVAFGSLPAVATLALSPPVVPPAWMVAAGALLGVGAHLVNALPDLEDDASTGVRGLPHRLGRRVAQRAATTILAGASIVVVLGPGRPPTWAWAGALVVAALALVSLRGHGRAPFRAAIAIAVVDVAMFVIRAGT